ncbi:4-diphosphocytidyl-2C-methyl-D-erythritol kinase [Achromobacter sp. RTa]|nr:4-diphosphocytidyl-2C-methyl-D-erythritol kinase [Achromobacter sp. RTa]
MKTQELFVWWADARAARRYRIENLSADDLRRAQAVRSAKAQGDWRVSRALLHEVRAELPPGGATSLSHSGGSAVCAATSAARPLGADLERIRPREVLRLADWVCTPEERGVLAGLDGARQLQHFYLMWTLKEAFIKAAALDFPADMASAGLAAGPDGAWRLRAPPGRWKACSWRLGDEWISSVVWDVGTGESIRPLWRTVTGCELPAVTVLGEWESGLV